MLLPSLVFATFPGLFYCQICVPSDQVIHKPSLPKITIYPMEEQLMIASGRHFNLSCKAEGTPLPRISWFKDGSPITSTCTEHGTRTSVIAFMPVRPENQGRYWCEANSTEGWAQSSAVFLTVMRRPYFVIHPGDVSVYQGENVTLSCLAAGFPVPVIGWLKDNESIDNFYSVGGNSSLALRFVQRQATNAKYRCIAKNSMGKTYSSEATLTVLTRQTTRDNANEKTSSTVFNPAWAWLGAVVTILLLSTAVVVIRKLKRDRRNTTNEDDHATNSEVITGYSRF